MRIYDTLQDALSEVQRDVYKGPKIISNRVQQKTGLDLLVSEKQNIQFAIRKMPDSITELIKVAQDSGNQFFLENEGAMRGWLSSEAYFRLEPEKYVILTRVAGEHEHPALKSTIEGSYVSYTYPERLLGMEQAILGAFLSDPYTRRAYWPIFNQQDALKAGKPTRIPCSLGYGFQLRMIQDKNHVLHMTYHMRSSNFDTFMISDLWLAHKIRDQLIFKLKELSPFYNWDIKPGLLVFESMSLHSFAVLEQEIY